MIISWVWVIHERLKVNWKTIHSIILSVTCHSIRNFSPLIHNPSYPFVNFWNSMIDYFLSLSHSWKIESELENNSLNNFICHLSFHKKLCPHPYTSPHIHLWIFETLQVDYFLSWVIHERLNVNWKTIHSITLSVTCHSIRTLSHSYTTPHIHLWIFETLQLIISWVWVIHERLNVNWKTIHSIILSVTCHSIRNFPPLKHIPSYPFMNFWNPTIDYFLSLSHSWKGWMWIGKQSLYNFICHLSFHKKLCATHIHPLISIHEFLKLYNWLFLEFESFMKDWKWIGKQFTQ